MLTHRRFLTPQRFNLGTVYFLYLKDRSFTTGGLSQVTIHWSVGINGKPSLLFYDLFSSVFHCPLVFVPRDESGVVVFQKNSLRYGTDSRLPTQSVRISDVSPFSRGSTPWVLTFPDLRTLLGRVDL